MGYSIFGEKIYVRSSDFLAAQAYLKEWESMKECGEPEENDWDNTDTEGDWDSEDMDGEAGGGNPLILKDRRVAAIIIIVAVVLGIISVFPPVPYTAEEPVISCQISMK
ncbi:hypothetical protein [Hungatella hathewayi]|uniref:hypothetical protein n=1 Tax=Hungatella hathewayi TaxID=154046 RepID=UPI003566FC25